MLTLLIPALAGAENNCVPVFAAMNINAWGWQALFSQIKCLMKVNRAGS